MGCLFMVDSLTAPPPACTDAGLLPKQTSRPAAAPARLAAQSMPGPLPAPVLLARRPRRLQLLLGPSRSQWPVLLKDRGSGPPSVVQIQAQGLQHASHSLFVLLFFLNTRFRIIVSPSDMLIKHEPRQDGRDGACRCCTRRKTTVRRSCPAFRLKPQTATSPGPWQRFAGDEPTGVSLSERAL